MKLRSYKVRAENLRSIVEDDDDLDATTLARKLKVSKSYISQLIGPHPTRHISEETARTFEKKLRLDEGALDADPPDSHR